MTVHEFAPFGVEVEQVFEPPLFHVEEFRSLDLHALLEAFLGLPNMPYKRAAGEVFRTTFKTWHAISNFSQKPRTRTITPRGS